MICLYSIGLLCALWLAVDSFRGNLNRFIAGLGWLLVGVSNVGNIIDLLLKGS